MRAVPAAVQDAEVLPEIDATESEDLAPVDEPEPSRAEDEPAAWAIEASFVVTFETLSDRQFTDEELDAFTYLNGAMSMHPFAREFVQSTTTRLGYPAFTMAFLRRPLDPSRLPERAPDGGPREEILSW